MIGRRWKRSNACSLAVLIGRGLNRLLLNLVSYPLEKTAGQCKMTALDLFTCFGANRVYWMRIHHRRGVEQWQLVGLITQRSQVRVLPPLPTLPYNGDKLVPSPMSLINIRPKPRLAMPAAPAIPRFNRRAPCVNAEGTPSRIVIAPIEMIVPTPNSSR